MKLYNEVFKFSDGRQIVITQENWDIGYALQEEQLKAKERKFEDASLQYFSEKIWPVLFAPSSGDIPSLEEAFRMATEAPADLDGWYKTVQKINSKWFTYLNHHEDVTVSFSDGSTVVVHDGNVPSIILKLNDLERDAVFINPRDTAGKQAYAVTFYSKFAACSTGDVLSEDEARLLPSEEQDKWYVAVKTVNPHWYEAVVAAQEEYLSAHAAELKKKQRVKPKK